MSREAQEKTGESVEKDSGVTRTFKSISKGGKEKVFQSDSFASVTEQLTGTDVASVTEILTDGREGASYAPCHKCRKFIDAEAEKCAHCGTGAGVRHRFLMIGTEAGHVLFALLLSLFAAEQLPQNFEWRLIVAWVYGFQCMFPIVAGAPFMHSVLFWACVLGGGWAGHLYARAKLGKRGKGISLRNGSDLLHKVDDIGTKLGEIGKADPTKPIGRRGFIPADGTSGIMTFVSALKNLMRTNAVARVAIPIGIFGELLLITIAPGLCLAIFVGAIGTGVYMLKKIPHDR